MTSSMNSLSTTLFIVALAASVLDWVAVARHLKAMEYIFKPLAAGLFLLAAAALEPSDSAARSWLAAALVFCILGDVFLMVPRDAFVPGLASFAVAQVLFTVSFGIREFSSVRLVVGLAVVVLGTAVLARRFIAALKRRGESSLIVPIVVYMTVISAMVVSSIAAGTAIAIIGALLFLISDGLIAEERFVRQRSWQPMTIIVTYHLALAGLVVGSGV